MENTKKNVSVESNASKNDGLKVVSLKGLNLNKEQLILKDDKLSAIIVKQFDELTDEEINKLKLCKAKVIKVNNRDRYGNVNTYYQAQFILCNGVVFRKNLSDVEVLTIQNFASELITDGQARCLVPVKLTTYITKNGNRAFNYTACLAPGVYAGTSRRNRADNGFIDEKTLNNIIAYNLTVASTPDKQVKFIDIDAERFERLKNSIEDDFELRNVEDF